MQARVTNKGKSQRMKDVALSKAYLRKFGPPLWGPHKTNHLKVVCLREHESNNGTRIPVGFTIPFCLPEHRDSWLASQHPRAWGKLLRKWGGCKK